jgi:hypothetical protein
MRRARLRPLSARRGKDDALTAGGVARPIDTSRKSVASQIFRGKPSQPLRASAAHDEKNSFLKFLAPGRQLASQNLSIHLSKGEPLKTIARFAVSAFLFLAAAGAQAAPWTFTKIGPARTSLPVVAPAPAYETLVFQMVAGAPATTVTRMSFQVTGNLPVGSLGSFELVFYPNGLGSPGTVVGTNSTTLGKGAGNAIVEVPLNSPFTPGPGVSTFVLRANVQNVGAFFYVSDLFSVNVSQAGVERILRDTEDLPMASDIFRVD